MAEKKTMIDAGHEAGDAAKVVELVDEVSDTVYLGDFKHEVFTSVIPIDRILANAKAKGLLEADDGARERQDAGPLLPKK